MSAQIKNPKVRIIAGPDSIDAFNINEIYQIANITVDGQKAVYGTRTVGLKSRSNFDKNNSDKGFMGCDFDVIIKNFNIFGLGGNIDDLKRLPSVDMAAQIYKDTGLLCSTEIMLPAIQLACIAKSFKFKPFMVWNSAVDQLGWHIRQMAGFAGEYDWSVGLKNGKWIGDEYEIVEKPEYQGKTSIESCWDGLVDYAQEAPEIIIINRGVDVPRKGEYRNLPIHYTAMRTKIRNRDKNVLCYFDPSHSLGPKMRDQIVDHTVEAMKMKISEDEYLYDGVLIEVGTAKCDTHQHITVEECDQLCQRIGEFRPLAGRLSV
jgi:hypothetical protein